MRTGDGFMVVFGVNDAATFQSISHFRELIKRAKDSDEVSQPYNHLALSLLFAGSHDHSRQQGKLTFQ